jgi:hypothetical protein
MLPALHKTPQEEQRELAGKSSSHTSSRTLGCPFEYNNLKKGGSRGRPDSLDTCKGPPHCTFFDLYTQQQQNKGHWAWDTSRRTGSPAMNQVRRLVCSVVYIFYSKEMILTMQEKAGRIQSCHMNVAASCCLRNCRECHTHRVFGASVRMTGPDYKRQFPILCF